jgi:hypothetical protein
MLTQDDLMTLEDYSKVRDDFRRTAIDHRRLRQVPIGPNCTLAFEDSETVKYQVQEMLYIERTFTEGGIKDELDAYNPLIPSGTNLIATMTLEYGDPELRRIKLEQLKNIEDTVFLRIQGHQRIYAIADEDLVRTNEAKTSAVHFLRFELNAGQIVDFKDVNNKVYLGISHDLYPYEIQVSEEVRKALIGDFA